MPKIINYDQASIYNGYAANQLRLHEDVMLIQIFDVGERLQEPESMKPICSEVYQFEFWDIDDEITGSFTQDQANEINQLLLKAFVKGQDVVVHCFMGVCRSGAVVQHAVDMGFDDPKIYRAPNLLVLHKLRVANGTHKEELYYYGVFGEQLG